MSTVFKLQRPITSTHAEPKVLAYDQKRQKQYFLGMDESLVALFGTKYKIYCECEVIDAKLVIGKRVADRGW